jgi:hypothetical protein
MTKAAATSTSSAPSSSGGSALARRDRPLAPWQNQDWQKLWLSTQDQYRPWRSLALVPAGNVPPEVMLQIAVSLSHTGMTHLGGAIHVADGTRVSLPNLMQFSQEMQHCMQGNDLLLIALSSITDNVTSVSLAQAADYSLLCVFLGEMSVADTKKTIDQIGRGHFIGSVVFNGLSRR